MSDTNQKLKELALAGSAFAASLILKKLLEEGYQALYKEEPPNAIKDEEVNWGKIIGWAIVSGVSAAALKVFIKRMGARKIDKLG